MILLKTASHAFKIVLDIVTPTMLVLGAGIIRGRRLLEVLNYFLPKIRGADIIRGRILLEGIRYLICY